MHAKKQSIKLLRWLASLVIVAIAFYLTESKGYEQIQLGEAPVLYSNACHDDLEEVFLEAINGANKSILLIIYSLSDTKLIQALNRQAEKGVEVKVMHDITTPAFGFQKLSCNVDNQGIKLSGLMHQKILVIDKEKVWIGSANMTSESLKLHDNLVIGLINSQLADTIEHQKAFLYFNTGGQQIEYWSFPQNGKEGVKRLIQLIDEAKDSLHIAMFTWTHHALTEAVIRAHRRGVHVEIVLDKGQANGVGQDIRDTLLGAGIEVRLSSGLGLLHHKFAWIDEKFLVNGSANWTASAFSRNRDCFLILHFLTEAQSQKMRELWKKTKTLANKEPSIEPLRLAA